MPKNKLPQTSLDAYKQVHPDMLSAHHAKIILALRRTKNGLMYEQIAAQVQLDKHQVGRRLSELESMQIIYKPGEKRKTASNREAFVYKLTAEGEAYIIPDKLLPGKSVSEYSKEIQAISASAQLKLL